MNKKKISIITDTYFPATGGAENAILELAHGISTQYDVTIITSMKNNQISGLLKRTILAPKFETYKDLNNIRVEPLVPGLFARIKLIPLILWHFPLIKRFQAKRLFDFLSLFYSFAMKKRLKNLIKESDLIISYSTSFTPITLAKLNKKLNIPLINAPVIHFGSWGDSPAQIKAYGKSNLLLCPTNHFKSMLGKFYKDNFPCKTAIVPHLIKDKNNIIKKPQLDIEANSFILFVGRREEHKGLNFLISAYKKSYCTIPLVIAGPGESIREEDNIFDLGKVSEQEKEWLLKNCRFLAVPSKDESFGIVYLEAMSHGRPSVALNIPPVNELLAQNETALLSVPGDSATLANNLLRLSEDNNLLYTLSENCRKEFKNNFSYDKILQTYYRVIKQTINGI